MDTVRQEAGRVRHLTSLSVYKIGAGYKLCLVKHWQDTGQLSLGWVKNMRDIILLLKCCQENNPKKLRGNETSECVLINFYLFSHAIAVK